MALLITATLSVVLFAVALAPLLGLIAWAERRQARHEKARVLAELADAKARGSHRPLSQHPQIDPLACVGCGLCVKACPEEGVLAVVDGVAAVVHGARCVGHGRCAEACPVGALQVGLGDLADHPDMPIVDAAQETSVPGVFIAGELSGLALIRHAIRQGTTAVDAIARRAAGRRAPRAAADAQEVVEVAIVGAGPAGLAAALRAIEHNLTHVLLEQDELGGTIRHYPRQKLVMTQPVELPLAGALDRSEYTKEELVAFFDDLVRRFPIRLHAATRVTGLAREPGLFTLATSRGPVRARHVVLALGRRGTPRRLEVPGEELAKVSYRLLDAARYRDTRALVVGGGDSAIEAALALAAQPGNRVALSYRKDAFFRLKPRNEARIVAAAKAGRLELLLGSEVVSIAPDSVLLRVAAAEGPALRELANDFVFVFAGGTPPFPLLRAIGVEFPAGGDAAMTAKTPAARVDTPA